MQSTRPGSFNFRVPSISTTCLTLSPVLSYPIKDPGTWQFYFHCGTEGEGTIQLHAKSGPKSIWTSQQQLVTLGFAFSNIFTMKAENIYLSFHAACDTFTIINPYLHGTWLEHKCSCEMQLILAKGCQCGGT